MGGATACKVAAVVCTAALTAGGAVEVKQARRSAPRPPSSAPAQAAAHAVTNPSPTQRRAALSSAAAAAPAPFAAPVARHPAAQPQRARRHAKAVEAPLAPPTIPVYKPSDAAATAETGSVDEISGGVTAPAEPPVTRRPGDRRRRPSRWRPWPTRPPPPATAPGRRPAARPRPAAPTTRAPRPRPGRSGDDVARRRRPLAARRTRLGRIDRYLETLEHEELLVRRGRRSGLFTIVAVHSTARGPSLGGCRMWSYADSRDAIADALRLSRAMTFKAAVADLPLGRRQGRDHAPRRRPAAGRRGPPRRPARLRRHRRHARRPLRTAEDVGTSDADMTVIAEGTRHVTGLAVERGSSGDPSPWTALGVQEAIHVACERVWGTSDLERALDRRRRARPRRRRRSRAASRRPARGSWSPTSTRASARWPTSSAPTGPTPTPRCCAEVDVLAPCALGGVLDDETVPALRCRAIAGAANNQLAAEADRRAADRRATSCGRRTSSPTPAASSTSRSSSSPRATRAERAEQRVRAVGGTLRTIFDEAEAAEDDPAGRRYGAGVPPPG